MNAAIDNNSSESEQSGMNATQAAGASALIALVVVVVGYVYGNFRNSPASAAQLQSASTCAQGLIRQEIKRRTDLGISSSLISRITVSELAGAEESCATIADLKHQDAALQSSK